MKSSEIMNTILMTFSNEGNVNPMEVIKVYNEAFDRVQNQNKTLENFVNAWYQPILEEMLIAAKEVLDD